MRAKPGALWSGRLASHPPIRFRLFAIDTTCFDRNGPAQNHAMTEQGVLRGSALQTPTLRRRAPERAPPTRISAVIFSLKSAAFQARRALVNLRHPIRRHALGEPARFPHLAAQSRTPLWSDPRLAETGMQRGKVHNLRAAAKRLDSTLLPAGETFSFWRQVGKATRARGFVAGRMLQEGCLVRSLGGGLCQLSNALYDVALQARCEIVERHGHSRIVPGSAAAFDRDATIAWNYVDLRFRAPQPLLLRVRLEQDALVVSLYAAAGRAGVVGNERTAPTSAEARDAARDCATCDETACFRHGAGASQEGGSTAFIVDEFWPEFDDFIAGRAAPGGMMCLPIEGRRWKRPNYAWRTHGLKTITAPVRTLQRALASRRLAAQGAARQRTLLRDADRMALALAHGLSEDVTEIFVAQSFLPALWSAGLLGGRRFTVLATRLPMHLLHERLDAAALAHPDRPTLADFRADAVRLAAEQEALAHAHAIVTPNAEIASLFGARAMLLPWRTPIQRAPATPRLRRIAFPGPTAARKGAYEVREAARALDIEVAPLGADLEGADFWAGTRLVRPGGADWFCGVSAVVQPAWVEERPRRLLQALSAGIPVIATSACGISSQTGLTLIAPGSPGALQAALESVLTPKQ
jgi:hypothetical protein